MANFMQTMAENQARLKQAILISAAFATLSIGTWYLCKRVDVISYTDKSGHTVVIHFNP
jgi:hypothetical protein